MAQPSTTLSTLEEDDEDVAAAIHEAVLADDRAAIDRLIDALTQDVLLVDDPDDTAELARQREKLGRAIEPLEDGTWTGSVEYALGRLKQADQTLDLLRTRAVGRRNMSKRARRAGALREQLIARLESPCRPTDLARELAADPAQVSRILRSLREEGTVVCRRDNLDRRGLVYETIDRQPTTA